MTSKIKYILAGILTIIIFIGLKFGPVNELYKLDTHLEGLYDDLDKYVAQVETYSKDVNVNEKSQLYELQEKINYGRQKLDDVESYIDEKNNPRIIKEEILPGWSERLDNLQQIILTREIDDAIAIKESNDQFKKEEFINNILENLPQNWKEYLVNLLNS